MIEARNPTKAYDPKLAVSDLSFTISPGMVTDFLGPNGAGKTTTMRNPRPGQWARISTANCCSAAPAQPRNTALQPPWPSMT
jgi:ABC-type hemin transport system ATPase subunit